MDDLNKPKPAPPLEAVIADEPLVKTVTISQAPVSGTVSQTDIKKEKTRSYVRLGILVVVIIAAVWLTLSYIITPTLVNGISMQPTFYTGNVVLVWEFPETWAKITNSEYIPNRGNIVIIKQTPVSGEDLIKRVVGLPNETINISNNVVTIYNPTHPNGFNPDSLYFKQAPQTAGLVNTQIGAGKVFVMGDNRLPGASIDSRSSIGPVSSGDIEGRVILRIYPFNQMTLF
ncbi:MAG TPA: signal peptidase I [Candidatus Saccharimonadales bacterium]